MSYMANTNLTSSTLLFDVPPCIMENFCKLMDCTDGKLGWRGLGERLISDWKDFRKIEKYADQGKSRTKEMVWSWAHKNKTVGDLLLVLQEMGHQRALSIFREINALPPVSLQEIKVGTNNFSNDLLIGEGQFCEVYKAEIKKQLSVVKLLKQKNETSDKQQQVQLFMTQWKGLPRVQHPNILELLGYVMMDDSACLVYPYMKNGSLFHRLHSTEDSYPLSWELRHSILLGVAQAITFLHAMSPRSVICGNVTSKNILLDQHFQPKLSDFAMVHLRSYLINHINTIKMDHAMLRLLGYLPEEYIRRGDLSVKTDVYSYGIIIMEVLSGCQAVLNGSKATFLREHFWEQMEKDGVESLLHFKDIKTSNWPLFVVENLLHVSFKSTALRAKQRPTMSEVLKRLENCNTFEKLKEDLPKPLMSVPPYISPLPWSILNAPLETDETMDMDIYLHQIKKKAESPCECSQSEVTFLGNARNYRQGRDITSLLIQSNNVLQDEHLLQRLDSSYTSRPVECSCSSGPYSTSFCKECIENGFGHAT
ncbi:interleukin-1 receptor-associated kinase 3 [Hyperolius riggenbachi]|uniref:interleukin-1 receptor-associated kinase 3 n=1 Tax=Hyperolius riggenbachi TaxID=752182 RepID=UPI0035A37AE8